jgi:hypothetical protein
MRKARRPERPPRSILWLWSAAACVFAAYLSLLFVIRIG